jgi:uncharacterized protein involved in exopolysaccharide biosynthesis
MSESTISDIVGFIVDRWFRIVIFLILLVVIAFAWHWISEKLGL